MKTNIVIVAFSITMIASFSFATANKDVLSKVNTVEKKQIIEPMRGFILEDKNQF